MVNNNIEVINDFLKLMKNNYGCDYLNDEHCIGILFYGSRRGNFVTSTSDLDLCIVYDDTIDYFTKGVETVRGVDVEYFEKSISDLVYSVDKDYKQINTAPLSMYGMADIIFERNNKMTELQNYIKMVFSKPFVPCSSDEMYKDFYTIKNRIDSLKELSFNDDGNFDLMFYNILDRVKTIYHKSNCITRLEISKAIRAYIDNNFAKVLLVDDKIDSDYINLFLKLLNSRDLSNKDRYEMLVNFFEGVCKYSFDDDVRIKLIDKNSYASFMPLNNIGVFCPRRVSNIGISDKLDKFINKMGYRDDSLYVGLLVMGDNLLNKDAKSIDVTVLFNSCDRDMYMGSTVIDGVSINYTEINNYKRDKDDNVIKNVYRLDKCGYLINVDTYYYIYSDSLDKIDLVFNYMNRLIKSNSILYNDGKYKEEVSIIRNRFKRLIEYARDDSVNYFDMYYSIILSKIISLYRGSIGCVYINDINDNNKMFLELHNNAVNANGDNNSRLNEIISLYDFIKGSITFSDNYRIVQYKDKRNNKSSGKKLELKK